MDASVLVNEEYLKHDLTDPIDDNTVSKYKIVVSVEQDEMFNYKVVERKTFRELVTKTKDVPNINACALSGKCEPGTMFAIEVNDEEIYNFYVISDDGEEVTLIMDRNLGDKVAWVDETGYVNAGGKNWPSYGANNKGPVTAILALKERTMTWTNMELKEYVYSDDGGNNRYQTFTETMRTRMITYTETTDMLNCGANNRSCPSYLYTNLSSSNTAELPNGYWTSSANSSYSNGAWHIDYQGRIVNCSVNNQNLDGVRPVITVSRSL